MVRSRRSGRMECRRSFDGRSVRPVVTLGVTWGRPEFIERDGLCGNSWWICPDVLPMRARAFASWQRICA